MNSSSKPPNIPKNARKPVLISGERAMLAKVGVGVSWRLIAIAVAVKDSAPRLYDSVGEGGIGERCEGFGVEEAWACTA